MNQRIEITMKTIIMAGGRGSRLSDFTTSTPKPLIEIEGKPVLEREIECLRSQGFTELIISVSYRAEQIIEYFGDGSDLGVSIEYYIEKTPLGNAGALLMIRNKLDDDFLLLNADSIFEVNFQRFVDFHKSKKGLATLFTHPNSHPYDSGVLLTDSDGSVKKWFTKDDKRPIWYRNRVNAGIHILNPLVIDTVNLNIENSNEKNPKVDLDRDILKPLCGTGKMFCYDSPEYVKDMGTPDRYFTVCADYRDGIVQAKNLKNKQKAVFLDRDGTINKYVGFLKDINQFELIPGVAQAIKAINESGYLAIVVTNQPVIARGEVSPEYLNEIHNKMETLLGMKGAYLDAIYYCPHHPDKGYEGEVLKYKIDCSCRKPKPGMLLEAAKDYNIDLSSSWMVGDGENDIRAGKAAGCKTALIGSVDFHQDITVNSLNEFVDFVIGDRNEKNGIIPRKTY